ncbi:MAG: thioesterase family protein [Myxococcota bacterium]|jgi:acyl-CoA thioester hydrolase|nr:thioesterase family protein [Myxococcota bacterium]
MTTHVPHPSLLEGFPVTLDVPVAWGEMDAFQHVNNVAYFRYMESGRIAYFEQVGIVEHMKAHSVGPILAETRCRFRAPLFYPDTLTVGVRSVNLASDRFLLQMIIVSHSLGRIAAEGDGNIVYYDYEKGARADVPDPIRQALIGLEGEGVLARDDR